MMNGEPPPLKNGEQSENERAHGNQSSNRTADWITTNILPLESARAGDSLALVDCPQKVSTDRALHVQARSIHPMIIGGTRNGYRHRSIDDDDETIDIVAAGLLFAMLVSHHGWIYPFSVRDRQLQDVCCRISLCAAARN